MLPHFALALLLSSADIKIYNEHTNVPVNGVHYLFMDMFPKTFDLDVSTAYEGRTRLQLKPERGKRKMDFGISDKEYELEYWMGCEQHFFGENCDIYCRYQEGSHISCSNEGEPICDDGWNGPNCTIKIDPCSSSPCLNGAQCVFLASREFRCDCPAGFEGMLCDRRSIPAPTSSTPSTTTEPSSTTTISAVSDRATTSVSRNRIEEEKEEIEEEGEEIIVTIEGTSFDSGEDSCWRKGVLIVVILLTLLIALGLYFMWNRSCRRQPQLSLLPTTTVSSKNLASKEKQPLSRTASPRYVSLPWSKQETNPAPPILPDSPPEIYLSSNHTNV